MNLLDYTYEIWTISALRNVDVGVATDMFLADIQSGEAQLFNTADSLPNFDFAALKTEWDGMTSLKKAAALEDWREFRMANYEEICEAFAGGEDAVIALVNAWRSDHEDN